MVPAEAARPAAARRPLRPRVTSVSSAAAPPPVTSSTSNAAPATPSCEKTTSSSRGRMRPWSAPCSRSTSACRRTCRGRGRPSSPASSRTPSPDLAACASSTSTATARATWPATAASSAPSSSTRSTRTATGNASSDETTSSTGSSARTSPIEGLSDDEVCIGDRYRIGTAVFEVTQPRVTCYRVGIRMNDPRIPALLVSHRRPGFYFRVLEEGEVQAGDEIIKLASGPEQMTVAEVDALLYLPGHPRQQLLRALRIPALSPGWQASFRALVDGEPGSGNAGLAAASPPPAWPGFRRLTVTGIDRESDSVISIRLEDPDGAPLPPARPGQYLTLRLQPDDEQRSVLRNYSLSGPPDAGYYRITVKREHDGAASGYLHTRLARRRPARDRSAARHLHPRPHRRAGPADQRRHRRHARPRHAPRARRGAHRTGDLVAPRRAQQPRPLLRRRGPRAARLAPERAHPRLLQPPGPGRLEGRDFDSAGRLTASLLAELEPPRDADAYLCGPIPFMDEISAGLAAMGIDASRIHTEPFGPAPGLTPGIAATPARTPHPPAGRPGDGPTIEFARSDLAVPWSSDYASLLELAEACDVPVRWSCRTGVCHNCETHAHRRRRRLQPRPGRTPRRGKRAHLLLAATRRRGARSVTGR